MEAHRNRVRIAELVFGVKTPASLTEEMELEWDRLTRRRGSLAMCALMDAERAQDVTWCLRGTPALKQDMASLNERASFIKAVGEASY